LESFVGSAASTRHFAEHELNSLSNLSTFPPSPVSETVCAASVQRERLECGDLSIKNTKPQETPQYA